MLEESPAWRSSEQDLLAVCGRGGGPQVASRFYNAHAIFNAALSFRKSSNGKLSKVRVAVGSFDSTITGQNFFLYLFDLHLLSHRTQQILA